MIAVIADDFTGAAEIGGIGLRYGMDVVIETSLGNGITPDLLIIATNTRSMSPVPAAEEIRKITGQLLALNPEMIFKKLDSVLRGNVADEISAQMEIMGNKRALVVAGNPRLGRTITGGIYRVNEVMLHQTSFAGDPEFPRRSSSVLELVQSGSCKVSSCSPGDRLPESGIIIGDVNGQDDMMHWAGSGDGSTVLCGSAGFFDEILDRKFRKISQPAGEICRISEKSLFVLGSLFPKSEKMMNKINGIGMVKMNMPDHIYKDPVINDKAVRSWSNDIIEKMSEGRVVITIDNKGKFIPAQPEKIRKIIGKLIFLIMEKVEIRDLLIEGGATTYEVFRYLNIRKLYPFLELDLGIIRMKVEEYPELVVTTKPGSYSWPEGIEFQNIEKISSERIK